jgi:hypothetical protein
MGADYQLTYSYAACKDTKVKYNADTCPWSTETSFNAGSFSFEIIADHDFCEITEHAPYIRYRSCRALFHTRGVVAPPGTDICTQMQSSCIDTCI